MALVKKPNSKADNSESQLASLDKIIASSDKPALVSFFKQTPTLSAEQRRELIDSLVVNDDAQWQQIVLNHIAVDASMDELQTLLAMLRSESASLRNQVIDALASSSNDEVRSGVADQLESLVFDQERDVRILALNLAALFNDPVLISAIENLLSSEQDASVCATGLETLIILNASLNEPLLGQLSERFNGEAFVQFSITQARQQLSEAD